jgi:hypothetical protein
MISLANDDLKPDVADADGDADMSSFDASSSSWPYSSSGLRLRLKKIKNRFTSLVDDSSPK